MPLIVLSNRYILHIPNICIAIFTAPTGARLCYFPESNAKALSTCSALSKVPLRPAGGFSVLTDGAALRRLIAIAFRLSSQHRNNAISIIFATLQSSRTHSKTAKF